MRMPFWAHNCSRRSKPPLRWPVPAVDECSIIEGGPSSVKVASEDKGVHRPGRARIIGAAHADLDEAGGAVERDRSVIVPRDLQKERRGAAVPRPIRCMLDQQRAKPSAPLPGRDRKGQDLRLVDDPPAQARKPCRRPVQPSRPSDLPRAQEAADDPGVPRSSANADGVERAPRISASSSGVAARTAVARRLRRPWAGRPAARR